MVRINKYLSQCGVASRRASEKLIAEGRVAVNDVVIEKLGTVVDETSDQVKVDGKLVTPVAKHVYIVMNKPREVMTTLVDQFKRRTVAHLLKRLKARVYPVGRLDYDTEGILLLTNHGELAYRLTHPKYEIPKLYEALVEGQAINGKLHMFEEGIKLEDGAIGHAKVELMGFEKRCSRIRLTLTEGRKREVKQLCKAVGHPVTSLWRIAFAGIEAKDLKPGEWRHLTPEEVASLIKQVGL